MNAKLRRYNITGAPFKIGQLVRVVSGVDDTADMSKIGQVGRVAYFEYNCGCGQSFPGDPMIGISFAGGDSEEYWFDELATT